MGCLETAKINHVLKLIGDCLYCTVPASVSQAATTVDAFLPHGEVADCLLSTERIQAIFLYPTQAQVQRIRARCHMNSHHKDPFYNPSSKGLWHRIIYLMYIKGASGTGHSNIVFFNIEFGGKVWLK